MFEPLNIFIYLRENYKTMLDDYKISIFILNFLIIPILLSMVLVVTLNDTVFNQIITSSIAFFSIIVGFLINVLILLTNTKKYSKKEFASLENSEKIIELYMEKLRKNLSYNILTTIIFGIFLIVLIIFLPSYLYKIIVFDREVFLGKSLILFFFAYFMISLVNILSKFGVYILGRFEKKK
ncbi:hypothetical protein J4226_02940 [Candidatus Pacearchaeota archaeon]|nr:hypothetical protein [Candidatus Pacearchaeota archaeon]